MSLFRILEIKVSVIKTRFKVVILIMILLIISLFSNPVLGVSDTGIIAMQIIRPGFTPNEQFSVKCFYYDLPKNQIRDETWTSVCIPNESPKRVRLKLPTNLKTETPSRTIPIKSPGQVMSWDVQPYKGGNYKIILEYFVDDNGPYKLQSNYVTI